MPLTRADLTLENLKGKRPICKACGGSLNQYIRQEDIFSMRPTMELDLGCQPCKLIVHVEMPLDFDASANRNADNFRDLVEEESIRWMLQYGDLINSIPDVPAREEYFTGAFC